MRVLEHKLATFERSSKDSRPKAYLEGPLEPMTTAMTRKLLGRVQDVLVPQ
jgi:hypothetical protein